MVTPGSKVLRLVLQQQQQRSWTQRAERYQAVTPGQLKAEVLDVSRSHFEDFFCIFRYERLEEQLNDLTELHQNEMTNLKQELASMEEKVAYQSYERARDIQVKSSKIP